MKAKRLTNSARAQCCWALANNYSFAAAQILENPTNQVYLPTLFLPWLSG